MDHPNIVKYLGDYQGDGNFYIAMEIIRGGNLRKFVEKYKKEDKIIPETLLIFIFSQLISALKYCFDQKIIHGDIKSENILINDSNVVKLADFGISKVLPSHDFECDPASTPGSLDYVSPEKIYGSYYSYSADIWSLGAVFY
jgi:serine/threonine protein kinase